MRQYNWRTHAIEQPTADTLTIHFDTGGVPFSYAPGQFINLTVELADGKKESRSYSLSSAPGIDERPAITVKAVEDGLVSNYILSNAEKIGRWSVEGPFGNFTPKAQNSKPSAIVLIAGGSGITPLWSISKTLLHESENSITLIYASRRPSDVIFSEQLRTYEQQFGSRFRVHHVFSRTDDATAFYASALRGRLEKETLAGLLKNGEENTSEETHYFLCGPTGLMEVAQQTFRSLAIPEESVFTEHFTTPSQQTPQNQSTETFEVLIHASGRSSLVAVPPGSTILDAALADGIPLRYSCKTGTCGTCTGHLLSGNVHMDFNAVLSNETVVMGYVLLCQSRPADDAVTIEAEAKWTDILEMDEAAKNM